MTAQARETVAHATGPVGLFVATRKGAWILKSDGARRRWELTGPIFLGHIVHHLVLDPRDRRTLLMAARTGHLGPTVFRSTDAGASWKETTRPPAFPKASEGAGRVVDHVFWLSPGHASEPDVWYAGTSPEGLFRSEDGGRAGRSSRASRSIRCSSTGRTWIPSSRRRTARSALAAVYITRDAGQSWQRQDRGLPASQAWLTVRQSGDDRRRARPGRRLLPDHHGEVWGSTNEGARWSELARHLPLIHAVEAAELAS